MAKQEDQQNFRAIAAYAPAHADEIKLSPGDQVVILHAYDDGWVLGRNVTSNSVGLLPRNFLMTEESLKGTDLNSPTPVSPNSVFANERRSSMQPRSRRESNIPKAANTSSSTGGNINSSNVAAATAAVAEESSKAMAKMTINGPTRTISRPGISDTKRFEEAKKKWVFIQSRREGRARVPANMGSLRISIAGDSGIGKTSLIKSLLALGEITSAETLPQTDGSPSICEVRASTVPSTDLYTGEDALNLTYVDTPGFGSTVDTLQVIRPVVDYHQQQFARTDRVFSREVPPSHIVKFLRAGVGAHTHVDICIYGVLHRLTPVDLEFMRRLSTMVNIVPVILKCDTLKPEEVFRLKATILEELQKAKISIYTFGMTSEELIDLAQGGYAGAAPFAFSAPEIMGEIGGARPGSYAAEFMQFKTALLYNHIDDFRTLTAEKFVNWRQNANGGSGGGR